MPTDVKFTGVEGARRVAPLTLHRLLLEVRGLEPIKARNMVPGRAWKLAASVGSVSILSPPNDYLMSTAAHRRSDPRRRDP